MSWFEILKVQRTEMEFLRNMDRDQLLAEQKRYKDSGKHEEYIINAMLNGYDFDNAVRIAYDIVAAKYFARRSKRFDSEKEPTTPMTHVRMLRRQPA